MIWSGILLAVKGLGFLVVSMLLHEVAHSWAFTRLGRPAPQLNWKTFEMGTEKDYEGLAYKDLWFIYASGVYAGTLPLILGAVTVHAVLILLLVPYLALCKTDIRQMRECRKKEKQVIQMKRVNNCLLKKQGFVEEWQPCDTCPFEGKEDCYVAEGDLYD